MARKRLARLLGVEALSATRFPTGSHHYVYDCQLATGGSAVVRLSVPTDRRIVVDAAQLSDQLRPIGIPLPKILARDLVSEFPCLVLERLPGTDLGHVIKDLSPSERRTIGAAVVRMQNIVAALPSDSRFGFAANAKDAPHSDWCAVQYESLERSRSRIERAALMGPRAVDRVHQQVTSVQVALNQQLAIPYLHDVTTKNVIVDDGRLSGIVDVDDLCFGDPRFTTALTLMSLLNSGGPLDYVASWLELAGYDADWKLALYAAVCCVDFMSEYGQEFNGNVYVLESHHRQRLELILDKLLAAARGETALSEILLMNA